MAYKTSNRRLNHESSRNDILTNVVDKVKSGEISKEELTAHASTLVSVMSPYLAQGYLLTSCSIAGGETVSTFLTATTYYLCQNPQPYQKLRGEIRARYQSYDQIDAATALQLPYLQAVIQEGLRIFPPGSQGFPRTSPGVLIDDNFIPAGVSPLFQSSVDYLPIC